MTKVAKVKVVDNIREVATVFEKLQNVAFDFFFNIGIFDKLLSTYRFARKVEWDFFCDFQTPCEVTPYLALV